MTRDATEWGAAEWCVRFALIMGLTFCAAIVLLSELLLIGIAVAPVLGAAACHRIGLWLSDEIHRAWGLG
jgi:hypothetical protein